jgi:hypothetical protein
MTCWTSLIATRSAIRTSLQAARRLAAALVLCGSGAGHAAIAPGGFASGANAAYSGNGELALFVVDATAQVSYSLDLGITLNDFFIAGQPDAGVQMFIPVDDANWTRFLSMTDPTRLRWEVTGFDSTGGTAAGAVRWFVTASQGDEGNIALLDNIRYYNVANTSLRVGYYGRLNQTGTHSSTGGPSTEYALNGSSVNTQPDLNSAYWGIDVYHNISPDGTGFGAGNAVGKSSWFYYLTRSGSDQTALVTVDEFDNLGHDGYWGFTYVDPATDSPYAGKYLLSYTLQAAGVTAAQAAFAAGIGRTEYTGGFSVSKLGPAAAAVEQPAAFASRMLGAATLPAQPVPEPASAALVLAGLGWLAARAQRRRGPAPR